MAMRRRYLWVGLIIILIITSSLVVIGLTPTHDSPSQTYNAELEYLKAIHGAGPAGDPRITFSLMAQYLNAHQLEAGIEFFESLIEKYESQLSSTQKPLYLSALGILRASYADQVPLLKRIGWVNETVDILENAREISNNGDYAVRWATGIVYAQLPKWFGKREVAFEDLTWLIENSEQAPTPGLLREVYYQLAVLHHQRDNEPEAQKYLTLSGYNSFDKEVTIITPWAVVAQKGVTFHPRRLREIIPGKVYNLSGFEFTEYNFIVSEDGTQLISIDMGTRPDSAQDAYEYLKAQVANLPPLTTVFMTHSHWDHIGGYNYFQEINPNLEIYARANYHEEWERVVHSPDNPIYMFGTDFKKEFLVDYKPDVMIRDCTEVVVGGTRFKLIPIPGGETPDGMFIFMPEQEVLFAGDFIMPMLGDPIQEEGNIPGLFEAIDVAVSLQPKHILHGHEGLTWIYPSADVLAKIKVQFEWLYEQTVKAIRSGMARAAIHHLNLIPPSLFEYPEVQFPYLLTREFFINRVYDHQTGIWRPADLEGLDHLSQQEYGALLTHYLKRSESDLKRAIKKMLQSGDYELAAKTAGWALTQYRDSRGLAQLRKRAFTKLVEKYQIINPFKLGLYSHKAEYETPQLDMAK
ncbi:MAG: MBL fold metallo-hydrolase [Candidatus Poribacteria bacterium]|nr:MBL fold metallo-hydrolase [Candidatus Poribacteria bacterium]